MEARYRIVTGSVTMAAADTEYEIAIPQDATEIVARLDDDSAAWRFSATAGEVAGGAGFPLLAGEDLAFDGPITAQTIYVAHDGAGAVVCHTTWSVPFRGRP